MTQTSESSGDRSIVRDLAKRVAEVAALPIMSERKEMWRRHNRLKPGRPLILVFPEGGWNELIPWESLRCQDRRMQGVEMELRHVLYEHEHFASDKPVEAEWVVRRCIRSTGWGLEPRWRPSDAHKGARGFDPVVQTPADLKKFRAPRISHDQAATEEALLFAQDLLGDILKVRLRTPPITFHLMAQYTALRGLEQVMCDMYEEPQMLHDAMAFLEEGHLGVLRQHVEQNLLTLNNESDYCGSGGVSYSDELPSPGFDPGHVRPIDQWGFAEAQEMAQVSPEMHERFSLVHERRLLEHFGLNAYGCCEDLTAKLDLVFQIPRIRRISISPWADVDRCAESLGNGYIFSWKPHPAHLAGEFHSERVRAYIRHTLEAAQGCVLEMVLKDTHTCDGHPERFDQWTRIAWEEVQAASTRA